MMSNSASRNGGATLFFTTFAFTRLPTIASPFFTCAMRRMSIRTDAANFKASPPGVVSGLPNMMPIFMRSWLMKMIIVWPFAAKATSLRRACAIILACRPTCCSPISPSSSARGVSAATESTTTTEIMPDRTKLSKILSASSPLSGCEMRRSFTRTPRRAAYSGSIACSASMNAHWPPCFCACAMTFRASVVFPLPSGP